MELVKTLRVMQGAEKLKQWQKLSPDAREALADSLVGLGLSAAPGVMKTLGHAQARGPALEILDRILDDRSVAEYLEALASPNPAIVSGVTKVLAKNERYDPARLLPGLTDARVSRSSLEAILNDKVARLRPRSVLDFLATVDKPARVVLFRLLEKCHDPELVHAMVTLATDADWWVRLQVAKVLSNIESQAAIDSLESLVGDVSNHVRLQAVKGLRARGAVQAIPQLAARLGDVDLKVQTEAIDALIQFNDVGAVPHLLHVLSDESEHARRGAVEVLNAVATTEAIQDLIAALRDKDWWVRVRAADALGALGGDRVVEAVVCILDTGDDFQRRYVVEILNAVPHEKAVEPLIRALNDPDWWVRERSIDALGNIRDPRAVKPLIEIMDSDPRAEVLCARALARIGDPVAMDALARLARSEREDVRGEAQAAMLALKRGGVAVEARGAVHVNAVAEPQAHFTRPVAIDFASPGIVLAPAGPAGRASGGSGSGADGGQAPPPAARPRNLALNYSKLPDGTVLLDRYRVVRRIGSGGFGVVYLVHDEAVQDEIILKVLHPQLAVDEHELKRFVQELKLTRRVSSRHVIRIFDLLDFGGVHAVSMEYCPGRDLGRVLSERVKLPVQYALKLAMQACEGLAAAHAEEVIHRDIKPPNILIGPGDAVKIVDFGLACAQQLVGSRLTKSGLLVGTPEYMAPELISGEAVDHRVDIYSLGIVLYEMLTGAKPYSASNVAKLLFQHLEGEAVPIGQVLPGLPSSVAAVVHAAMARDAAARPQTARELLAMLATEVAALPTLESEPDA